MAGIDVEGLSGHAGDGVRPFVDQRPGEQRRDMVRRLVIEAGQPPVGAPGDAVIAGKAEQEDLLPDSAGVNEDMPTSSG